MALNPEILANIDKARKLYLDALNLIQTNKIVASKSGIVTVTREQLKNKIAIFDKFNEATRILNSLTVSSPEVKDDEEFTGLSRNIIEDYEKYLSAEDVNNLETEIGTLNNRLFISTQNTSIQQVNTVQTPQVQQTPQPEDYTQRTSTLNEAELKQLNETQTPDQKEALINDDGDILDDLKLQEDDLILVGNEKLNAALSDNPEKFRTDANTPVYIDMSKGIDSKLVTVKNKNVNVLVFKTEENEEYIKYDISIRNIDNNCLVIDKIIQIAGTDYSLINQETNISENEKIIDSSLGANLVTQNKEQINEFVKKFRPDFDAITSDLGNLPFNVLIPDFLNQPDGKAILLCPDTSEQVPQNAKIEIPPIKSDYAGNLFGDLLSGIAETNFGIGKLPLAKYQIAVLKDAPNWSGFCEGGDGKGNFDNWPVNRLIKNGKEWKFKFDPSLVKILSKYQNYYRGVGYCTSGTHAVIANALEKAKMTSHAFYEYINNAPKYRPSLLGELWLKIQELKGEKDVRINDIDEYTSSTDRTIEGIRNDIRAYKEYQKVMTESRKLTIENILARINANNPNATILDISKEAIKEIVNNVPGKIGVVGTDSQDVTGDKFERESDLCDPVALELSPRNSFEFAAKKGILKPYLVPGCPAYFIHLNIPTKPVGDEYGDGTGYRDIYYGAYHCILILEVHEVIDERNPLNKYYCTVLEMNGASAINVPLKFDAGSGFEIYNFTQNPNGNQADGGKLPVQNFRKRLFPDSDQNCVQYVKYDTGLISPAGGRFVGCAVPKEVQAIGNKHKYRNFISSRVYIDKNGYWNPEKTVRYPYLITNPGPRAVRSPGGPIESLDR